MSLSAASPPRVAQAQLASLLADRFAASRASGARIELESREEIVEDAGFEFIVRVLAERIAIAAPPALNRHGRAARAKADASTLSGASAPASERSPFLPPYDPGLLLGSVSETHVALLNKYNLVDRHLLIVTREHEEQEAPLTVEDFAAARFCLEAIEALVFYNAGTAAGASQSHKHLQLVPFPLGPHGERFPLDRAIAAAVEAGLEVVPGLDHRHRVARAGPAAAPDHAVYRDLLVACDADPGASAPLFPYNLLMTREWMLLIPRSRPSAGPIDVNALGFAGTLVARRDGDLDWLRSIGPIELLRRVGVSRR